MLFVLQKQQSGIAVLTRKVGVRVRRGAEVKSQHKKSKRKGHQAESQITAGTLFFSKYSTKYIIYNNCCTLRLYVHLYNTRVISVCNLMCIRLGYQTVRMYTYTFSINGKIHYNRRLLQFSF